jgi:hypothetical protein
MLSSLDEACKKKSLTPTKAATVHRLGVLPGKRNATYPEI